MYLDEANLLCHVIVYVLFSLSVTVKLGPDYMGPVRTLTSRNQGGTIKFT